MNENEKPIKNFNSGGLKASIWLNKRKNSKNEEYTVPSVILSRTFIDSNGEYKTTNSLNKHDILVAALLLRKCYEWIDVTQSTAKREDF